MVHCELQPVNGRTETVPLHHAEISRFQRVLLRFPGRESRLRREALKDRYLRAVCEDLALALESLSAFEARPDSADRPEIPEYRRLISDLEAEVTARLDTTIG